MGLFNFGKKRENEEETRRPGNPTSMIAIRLLAVGYVLWILKDLITAYIEGGEDAPSLTFIIVAGVVFVACCVWIILVSIKQYKRMKIEQREYNEKVAEQYRLEEEAAAKAQADAEEYEEFEEEPEEEYEEIEETEETKETEE